MPGGAEGDRTPDLRIANAALSQLSYGPGTSTGKPERSGPDAPFTICAFGLSRKEEAERVAARAAGRYIRRPEARQAAT